MAVVEWQFELNRHSGKYLKIFCFVQNNFRDLSKNHHVLKCSLVRSSAKLTIVFKNITYVGKTLAWHCFLFGGWSLFFGQKPAIASLMRFGNTAFRMEQGRSENDGQIVDLHAIFGRVLCNSKDYLLKLICSTLPSQVADQNSQCVAVNLGQSFQQFVVDFESVSRRLS